MLSVCVFVCLGVCVSIHARKQSSAFMCAFSGLHVWGLRGGVFGFSGCAVASRPNTFTCLCFGLSGL